jgi:hypothetical protein
LFFRKKKKIVAKIEKKFIFPLKGAKMGERIQVNVCGVWIPGIKTETDIYVSVSKVCSVLGLRSVGGQQEKLKGLAKTCPPSYKFEKRPMPVDESDYQPESWACNEPMLRLWFKNIQSVPERLKSAFYAFKKGETSLAYRCAEDKYQKLKEKREANASSSSLFKKSRASQDVLSAIGRELSRLGGKNIKKEERDALFGSIIKSAIELTGLPYSTYWTIQNCIDVVNMVEEKYNIPLDGVKGHLARHKARMKIAEVKKEPCPKYSAYEPPEDRPDDWPEDPWA